MITPYEVDRSYIIGQSAAIACLAETLAYKLNATLNVAPGCGDELIARLEHDVPAVTPLMRDLRNFIGVAIDKAGHVDGYTESLLE